MPNLVTTFVTVVGSKDGVAAFSAGHLDLPTGDVSFDLDSVIPIPVALEGLGASSDADLGFYALSGQPGSTMQEDLARIVGFEVDNASERHPLDGYGMVPREVRTPEALRVWLQEKRPEALIEGARHIAAFEATGFENQRQWTERHWGTSRNTFSTQLIESRSGTLTFCFTTAWTFPAAIFEALAAKYPALVFRVTAYEDEGSFALEGEYNGENTIREVDPSPDWYADPSASRRCTQTRLADVSAGETDTLTAAPARKGIAS